MSISLNYEFPNAIMEKDCIPRRSNKYRMKELFKEYINEKNESNKIIIYDALSLFIPYFNKEINKMNSCIFNILNEEFKNGCEKIYLIFDNKNNKNKVIKQNYYKNLNNKKIYDNYRKINKFIEFLKKKSNKHINFNVIFCGVENESIIILHNSNYKETLFLNNHAESDTTIWYIIKKISNKDILIRYSDTDITMICLLLYDKLMLQNIKITLQNIKNENENIYANDFFDDINKLFKNKCKYPAINYVIIYIISGCDYISPFFYISKYIFMETYKKYIDYIGDLIHNDNMVINVESCLKLIGLCYLEKYKKIDEEYFNNDLIDMKEDVVTQLREIMIKNLDKYFDKGKYDFRNLIPDKNSLNYHILRTQYILNIWNQSLNREINYFDPEKYGWIKNKNNIYIFKYKELINLESEF